MRAVYNDQVIAESDNTVVVEGNHYFPADSVKKEFLTTSDTRTTCLWKGVASYFNVVVKGKKQKMQHGATLIRELCQRH